MKYLVKPTSQFKRDYKRAVRRGMDMELLERVIVMLAKGETLPEKNRDHALSGRWAAHRECHVTPDWLLIYKIDGDVLVLTLTRTGAHADLFDE